jgi:hypothetical protein
MPAISLKPSGYVFREGYMSANLRQVLPRYQPLRIIGVAPEVTLQEAVNVQICIPPDRARPDEAQG